MNKKHTILGAIAFGLFLSTTTSALAQGKGYSLPRTAQEIEPGIYYLGRVKDREGRNIDGLAFLHPKRNPAKPPNVGKGGRAEKCYSFLANGARWKEIEDFVVAPNIAPGPNGAEFVTAIESSILAWESAAGVTIFGNGSAGEVDFPLIGTAMNDLNEVTFGLIAEPDVIGVTIVWGIFGGPPSGRVLVEWDMILNDEDFDWSATGEAGKMDFWNIFAHEIGHAAGLGHPTDTCTEETMFAYATEGEIKKRDLNAGDIAGIAGLYK